MKMWLWAGVAVIGSALGQLAAAQVARPTCPAAGSAASARPGRCASVAEATRAKAITVRVAPSPRPALVFDPSLAIRWSGRRAEGANTAPLPCQGFVWINRFAANYNCDNDRH